MGGLPDALCPLSPAGQSGQGLVYVLPLPRQLQGRAGGGQAAAFTRPHFRAVGKDRSQPLVQEGGGPVPSRPVGLGVADI